MKEIRAKLADGGRISIPAEYRKALGLHTGDEIIIRLENNELHILTPLQAIKHAQELVRRYVPRNVSLVDELIAERRLEQ